MRNYKKATVFILIMISGFMAQDIMAQLSINNITAQEELPKKRKKRGEVEKEKRNALENFIVSSGLSLGYSGGLYFEISPAIGYQVGEKLRVNAGVDYFKFDRSERFGDGSNSSFGPFANLQYLVYNNIFGQAQFQNLKYTVKNSAGQEASQSESSFLIGAGFTSNYFQPGLTFNVVISYNVLFEDTFENPSIYGSPFIYQAVLAYRF